LRGQLLGLLFEKEKIITIKSGMNPEVELPTFVQNTILPKSQNRTGDVQVTQSQAVEQVLAAATSNKWAPKNIFDPYNGYAGVKIERLNAR